MQHPVVRRLNADYGASDPIKQRQLAAHRHLAAMTAAIALLCVSAVCFGGAFLFVAVEHDFPVLCYAALRCLTSATARPVFPLAATAALVANARFF
jgi:hypothetical protein